MKNKKGSCIRNAVQYTVELNDNPKIYNYHCVDCRKNTGGSFETLIELREGSLKIDES